MKSSQLSQASIVHVAVALQGAEGDGEKLGSNLNKNWILFAIPTLSLTHIAKSQPVTPFPQ